MTSEMEAYRPHLQWVALNTFIWPACNIVIAVFLGFVGVMKPNEIMNFAVNFIIGLIIGFIQWLFLKKYYPLPALWILTIALSYMVFGTIHWIAGGIVASCSQYFLLQKYFKKPVLWFLISLIAALICFGALRPSNLFLFHGTIYGCITLATLWLEMRNNEING